MKEGWEYKTLGEIAKVFAGGDVPKNRMSKCKKEPFIIPIYTNGIENEGLYGYTDIARVHDLSLTISARGTIGAIFKRNSPFFPAIRLITVCPQNIVDINFLYYVLLNSTFTKSGTTIPQLTVPMLKQYRFAIPENISIQQNIANYLDSSFKLIDEIKNKALKSLTEGKALFESALAEAMEPKEGWEEKTLGEVSENIKNINLKNELSEYKYIDLSSVDRDKSIILNTVIVNKTNAPSRAKQLVNNNDIIFATTRPLLRRVTLIEKEYDKSICSTGFCVIRPNNNIIVPKYVFYVFKDEPFYQYIEPLQNGASYPAVTDKAVKSYTFSFPKNVEVQKQIVSRLDKLSSKVRAIEEKYQKMVEECDALKQAMLRDVFE